MLVAAKVKTDKSCGNKNACTYRPAQGSTKGVPHPSFHQQRRVSDRRHWQRILPSGQEVDMSVKVATVGKRQAVLSNIITILRATYILIHTGDDMKIICRFL